MTHYGMPEKDSAPNTNTTEPAAASTPAQWPVGMNPENCRIEGNIILDGAGEPIHNAMDRTLSANRERALLRAAYRLIQAARSFPTMDTDWYADASAWTAKYLRENP